MIKELSELRLFNSSIDDEELNKIILLYFDKFNLILVRNSRIKVLSTIMQVLKLLFLVKDINSNTICLLVIKFNFTITVPAKTEKLISIATDYENFQKFFPNQIKSINILKSNERETLTEETLSFSTILENNIFQQTIHKRLSYNKLENKVISGPFKNSTLLVIFSDTGNGTQIAIEVNMQIALKYRILSPIIKKRYRTALTALFYKMNTLASDR